ncbi:hypothetical protein NEMBOFW57_002393 [Staphylotrichum longicolle]|uniref:Myb-like domain-containing protein n=1 Tax=Staphylotrichum longicolle TaxID=669026 RepID=A0AAD4F7X5_9PEZI|nr:hypothetical protein NEMBOFW57_002393 [Staphylotrichum longicolle]
MLLPSALPCDSSQTPPLTRLQSALFASPPASPPQLSTQTAIGNIFSTCRSLQSLLTNPAPPLTAAQEPITPPTSSHANLPTPPLAHAPSPLKLRLRSRKTDTTTPPTATGDHSGPPRKRIVKRTASAAHQPPARGPNKRRRAVDDDLDRYNSDDSEAEQLQQQQQQPAGALDNPFDHHDNKENEPHTPKRSRIAPEVLPLGLERSDYHTLHLLNPPPPPPQSSPQRRHHHHGNNADPDQGPSDVVVEADGEMWSTEEDRMLVELVLEKLKLTKSDWQDCARSLGKDRGSVGRRWKSLMLNGEVGIKGGGGRGRARIHGTWR